MNEHGRIPDRLNLVDYIQYKLNYNLIFVLFYISLQREVSLFMSVKDGKVYGAESTPFVLPHRWTYQTLKNCVEDYINRDLSNGNQPRIVKQMYYKRARGKGVVRLDGDGDIVALLKEYPIFYPSGKRKTGRCVMFLAVDTNLDSNVEGKLHTL